MSIQLTAERAFVGALLSFPASIPEGRELVPVEAIGNDHLKAVLVALYAEDDARRTPTLVSVAAILGDSEPPVDGWGPFLLDLTYAVVSAAHLGRDARIVLNAQMRRDALEVLRKGIAALEEARPDTEEVGGAIDELDEALLALAHRADPTLEELDVVDGMDATLAAIDNDERVPGIETGIRDLDRLLVGLRPGEVLIVGARPGQGKTALGLQIAQNNAKAGVTSVFWSMEMRAQELVERVLCNEADIPSGIMRARTLSEEQKSAAREARALFKRGLHIVGDQATTLVRLRAYLRRRKRRQPIGLVVVDYIGLMSHPGAENRVQEVSALSRGLKSLAKELAVPMIVLCQLNRTTETSERPKLWHLKESGSLEQDADAVLLLWAEKDGTTLEADLAKNRGGQTRMERLSFIRELYRVRDLQWLGTSEAIFS